MDCPAVKLTVVVKVGLPPGPVLLMVWLPAQLVEMLVKLSTALSLVIVNGVPAVCVTTVPEFPISGVKVSFGKPKIHCGFTFNCSRCRLRNDE